MKKSGLMKAAGLLLGISLILGLTATSQAKKSNPAEENIVEIQPDLSELYPEYEDTLSSTSSVGSQSLEGPTQKIRIRAMIDGRDYVYIQGSKVWYEHFDYAAPGRHWGANEPTYINGVAWYPTWPYPPPHEIRFHCFSSKYTGLDPAFPNYPTTIKLHPIASRYSTRLVQAPTEANGYTLIYEWNDNPPPSHAWYEVEIEYTVEREVIIKGPRDTETEHFEEDFVAKSPGNAGGNAGGSSTDRANPRGNPGGNSPGNAGGNAEDVPTIELRAEITGVEVTGDKIVWSKDNNNIKFAGFNPGEKITGETVTVQGLKLGSTNVSVSVDVGGDEPLTDDHTVTVLSMKVCFTFDDGPHASGKPNDYTNKIIRVLNMNDIDATFFVGAQRITFNEDGRESLRKMDAGGHEIGIHGAHPGPQEIYHHLKHQDTPSLKDKLIAMKNLIKTVTGQTPKFVRPPYGWARWTTGTEYTKAQVSQIYQEVSLTRYHGDGTDGVNSWGAEVGNPTFWTRVEEKIEKASKENSVEKLVILSHDIRSYDVNHLQDIINGIRMRAKKVGVGVEFVTMSEIAE